MYNEGFGKKWIDRILGKVDKDQGVANAGKVLGIGDDGQVVPVEQSGGGSSITVDSALNAESTNPVQNGVITNALAGKLDDKPVSGSSFMMFVGNDTTRKFTNSVIVEIADNSSSASSAISTTTTTKTYGDTTYYVLDLTLRAGTIRAYGLTLNLNGTIYYADKGTAMMNNGTATFEEHGILYRVRKNEINVFVPTTLVPSPPTSYGLGCTILRIDKIYPQ